MTDALKLRFSDVSLEVLKEYLNVLHPKYKYRCDVDVKKEFPQDMYKCPYYFDDMEANDETWKYFMETNGDLTRIQHKLSKYDWQVLQVIYNNFL